MLKYVRDAWSVIGLGRRLEALREAQLTEGLAGRPVSTEWLEQQEARVRAHCVGFYYSVGARRLVGDPDAETTTDEQDAAARSNKLGEQMTVVAHRALVKMPWVGQAEFADPHPLVPAAGLALEPATGLAPLPTRAAGDSGQKGGAGS